MALVRALVEPPYRVIKCHSGMSRSVSPGLLHILASKITSKAATNLVAIQFAADINGRLVEAMRAHRDWRVDEV